MATVSCPHCSQSLDLPDDVAGKTVRCPQCGQTFETRTSSALANGEPPLRSEDADAAVTEPDFPLRRERRDIAKSSSWLIPGIVVACLLVVGLCTCGPAVVLLGFFPVMHAEHRQEAQVAVAEQVAQAEADAAQVANGFAKGVADAKNAILAKKLLWKEYPPIPAPGWHGEYIKLLKERCKCDYQVVGQPNLPKEQVDEIRGWNDTMRAELQRRHGATILADLNKEAEERWRARIKQKDK